MPETQHGKLIKRSLYEEYESSNQGGLCFDPHDPAFLGTLCLATFGLLFVGLILKAVTPQPTVIYPPNNPTVINNN